MGDEVTRQERARQVSESLHRWCQSQGVCLLAAEDSVGVYESEVEHDGHGNVKIYPALFEFTALGYQERTADEITVLT